MTALRRLVRAQPASAVHCDGGPGFVGRALSAFLNCLFTKPSERQRKAAHTSQPAGAAHASHATNSSIGLGVYYRQGRGERRPEGRAYAIGSCAAVSNPSDALSDFHAASRGKFGQWLVFPPSDLGFDLYDCAKTLAPQSYAMALALESRPAHDPDKDYDRQEPTVLSCNATCSFSTREHGSH